MAENPKKSTGASSVTELISRLDHPLKAEVKALRQIMLSSNNQIREEIKWNSPSFYIQQHFATFNLHNKQYILIILHRGAGPKKQSASDMAIQDPDGLIEWLGNDRGAVKFCNMADVISRKAALVNIVNQWIHQL